MVTQINDSAWCKILKNSGKNSKNKTEKVILDQKSSKKSKKKMFKQKSSKKNGTLKCIFTILIKGPNMSGKSTYLTTMGVVQIISQLGCFAPIGKNSSIQIYKQIRCNLDSDNDMEVNVAGSYHNMKLELSQELLRFLTLIFFNTKIY